MNITTAYENRRILLIDDNAAIHEDFRKILCCESRDEDLEAAKTELFGEPQAQAPRMAFEITPALQGEEGVALVQKSLEKGTRFAVAFVDVRMPPGWDGIETVERIWQVDPRLQVVLCTAYSDHSWQQIIQRLGQTDRLLILKKPFDIVEAQQLALTLTTKWNLARAAEGRQAALEAAMEMKTRQLASARSAAEAASQARSQSLASISHEIQAPMRAIVQFADRLMKLGDISKAPPARVEAIHSIIHSGQHLLALLNDVLDFSKIETGQMKLAQVEFDPHEVVQTTLQAHAAAAAGKNLELTWQVEPAVPTRAVGDPGRTGQILANLLSNAIKFTEQGSVTVQVSLEEERNASSIVRFSVTDTGIGIPMHRLDCLFYPFSQVQEPSAQNTSGPGLGLALSKRLAEMHGGNIGVSSAPDEGSTFWFTLELKHPTLPAKVPAAV